MLITNARLLDGVAVDVRFGELIEEVAQRLEPRPGEEIFDAGRGTVLPGLHDHHVHLRSAAAALGSVRVGPPDVHSRGELIDALAAANVGDDGWIRAIGYHRSVAGPLDRALLDEVSPPVPVRVQHRSGASWTYNTMGLAKLGRPELANGQLHRTDALADPIPTRRARSLRPLSETLASWGVTGVTDATPGYSHADVQSLSRATLSGELHQRLHCMAPPGIDVVAGSSLGPAKRILDDIGLDLDGLRRWIGHCHEADKPVAIHSVTASQLVVTIAALRTAGTHPLDRIEHAAMVPQDCIEDLAELCATVVTQPNFIAERGDDYLRDIPPEDLDQLWRVAALREAGVPVALSTDVPFGRGDPWAAMRAAVQRRTPSGVVLGATERVTALEALTMFFGQPGRPAVLRSVVAGQPGDLCVLDLSPADVLERLDATRVVATFVAGERVWPISRC